MKKILIFSMAIIGFTSLQAQKNIASSKVPAAAKDAFMKAHPNVTGKWEKEEGSYEVTFKESGKDMSCVVDKGGNILETETVVPLSDLPAPVTAYIAKHYKGVKVKEAAIIVKADGTTVYEAEIKGKDVIFDANGKVIKSKKDND
jgi:uncharacterized membrane protein YkoI